MNFEKQYYSAHWQTYLTENECSFETEGEAIAKLHEVREAFRVILGKEYDTHIWKFHLRTEPHEPKDLDKYRHNTAAARAAAKEIDSIPRLSQA